MRKKIHYLTTRLDLKTGGGSHRHSVSLVRLFREMGYEVEVHCLFSTRNFPPPDITPHTYEGEKLGYHAFQEFVANLMKKNEEETALFFTSGPSLLFGAGKYRVEGGSVPVASYIDNYLYSMGETQDDSTGTSFLGRITSSLKELPYRVKRALYDRTVGVRHAKAIDRYFVPSPYLGEVYERFGFPKKKFVTAPHFFDAPASRASRIYEKPGTLSLMYAGRLTYDKGVDLLLTALASLGLQGWRLHIVGDGPQKDTLASLAQRLGIEKNVTFVGWATSEAIEAEYTNADIFVHPTRWAEPMGRTIIEAMQYGIPLVVSKRGGPAWVAEGASLTFENGDARSLAQALSELLIDPVKRRVLGEQGVRRAHDFSREVLAPQFKKEIEKLLSR